MVDQDPEDPSEDPSVRGTTSILSWYDSSRPMYIDLVGDYAGKELFMVEGDSLLRHCFEDERIDFDGGFQLLHAAFVLERFLENLLKRHCNFHIAFFEENALLCIPAGSSPSHRSRYNLARSALKRHLEVHLPDSQPGLTINTFLSLESVEFKKYLNRNPIHFIMAHDGANYSSKEAAKNFAESDKLAKILLRGMIWFFNSHGLNVALINRIEFQDSKAFTMIVESFTPKAKTRLQMMTQFQEDIASARKSLKGSQEQVDHSTEDVDLESLVEGISEDLNESLYLAAYSVSKILMHKDCDIFLASAFLLHSVVLKHVTLSQRRLPLVTYDEGFEEVINQFLSNFSLVAKDVLEDQKWKDAMASDEIECDVVDLVDGRLFRVIIQAMCDRSFNGVIPSEFQGDWVVVSQIVEQIVGEQLSLDGSNEPDSSESTAVEKEFEATSENLSVLPFSSPVFDKHLECIHVTADTSIAYQLGAMKLYRETSHWHNHRKPLNPKQAPTPKVSKWRNPLRTNQFYMKEMTSYAASLTGAKGKILEPETIIVDSKEKSSKPAHSSKASPNAKKLEQESKSAGGSNSKKGTKKGTAGLSAKEKIIEANNAKKGSTESDKAFNIWATKMKDFEVISDDQDRYLKTISYLNSLDATKTQYLEGDINTFILQSLLKWWAGYCKTGKKAEGYHVVALIWTTVRSICKSSSPITKEIAQHVTKICSLLGIDDALEPLEPSGADRKLSFNFKYPLSSLDLRIEVTQSEFQLDYCGPYMDRMLDAKPDARVSSFIPDGWQRDVLDQLDANKSVFVVAPTSAGKTFISFYAMEQILRADNDGVLVYVAPTKALVNQIAAEIQGRFSKKFNTAGKGVWAIHTRDYRVNNSTGCQILVTVPHILQIMLLSPSNAKSWAPRVRKIIFDEIHSIGNAEDGVVWEQLLLLAPCPIIALSATVGNPEHFNEWLAETQKASGSDIKIIQHSTRYSDLRKYMFEPPKVFKFKGLGNSFGVGLGLDGLPGLKAFHPVASLVDKSRGMPDDLALEPKDCLSLWKSMCKFQTSEYKVPSTLDPSKALPRCIRKKDIFAWEKALKKVLLQWMADRESPFDQVVADLTPSTDEVQDEIVLSAASSATDGDEIDPLDLKQTTLPLLYQLHKRRALPAILFNYDRSMCEKIAYNLLTQLSEAETKWKEGPAWKKFMDGYEKYQELKAKKSRKPVKPVKKSKDDDDEGGSKTDRMREESSDGSSIYDLFDPEAPQPDFSFANPKQLQREELDEFIRQLRRKYINEELIDLLKRGIGIHHAGMNRKYRQTVEMLFRKGFLRVVVATGTLALGINMPCSTVVFSGDSVFLTALNFRQAAGRAGRRGFDLLGNVVFQGISKERASRLLSSRLPELTGHFPITTTLVLRLFTLLNDAKGDGRTYAEKAINSLLSQPRLYLGGQSFKEQVLHHLRFSIEYLRRNDLLGPGGEPVNFTSCVSHLYYTENSSFAFHALLKGGYFHKLCADIGTGMKTSIILNEMVLTLSHIFGRRVCREVDDEEEAERIKRSPSIVYLPAMPKSAVKILQNHNQQTLEIFTTYVKTFAAQYVKDEERYLPLTQTPFGLAPNNSKEGHINGNGKLKGRGGKAAGVEFLPSLPAPHARSTFVALSGLGDEFTTIEDLCSSAREGVFLESAVIPHLEIHPNESKKPLNAYLLDFFMHGSIKPLEDANGIRKSDVWFLLNDFSMVLATIATSLALYLGLGVDSDSEMLDVMGSGDAAENDLDAEIAETSIPNPNSTAAIIKNAAAAAQQVPIARKGKKVVDDWDAGEDKLTAEEDFLKSEDLKGTGATDDEEYEKLMNVYKAFRKLKTEFDAKFREIWA